MSAMQPSAEKPKINHLRHLSLVAVLVAAATLIMRWVLRYVYALPASASAEARSIDVLFDAHFWMIAFLFALIVVPMLYAIVIFRRQPGDETDGEHIHGSTALEATWIIIPILVVIGFGVWGFVVLNDLTEARPNQEVVQVTGRQWVWSFAYPDNPEFQAALPLGAPLYLKEGQPYLLEMTAADVLHSFWVPEFRVKQDLVPGRTTVLRITPEMPGTYKVRCAEICGTLHYDMVQEVIVMSPGDFDAFVADQIGR